ncbi:MAG: GerMN domain-containing protein [Bacilli bacterium]|nr:GerMN domain-containing protein [Bacilli bacterium]
MIKNGAFRRILVASFALLITIISIYLFPKDEVKIPSKTIYKKAMTSAIYLIDKNNYVARTTINIDATEKEAKAIELINALINGTNKNKYLPSGFTTYIPPGTVINKVSIEEDTITIDFNENFLNIKNLEEEKMIESLVYTLTEIDGIKNVKILINGNNLNKLPISGKNIPNILSRSIGINRKIKANSFKNTQDVTTYFINEINNNKYYIPVTLTTDNKGEKIEIIIKELEAKDNIDKNLSTYISAGTILQNYQILENEFNMEFNSLILNGLDNISEEVIYGLALSIKDNYDIDKISIDVNNKQILAYALKNS